MNEILYIGVGLFAGLLGSMVGLGGGIFIVPLLSLFFQVPIHQAIAASIVGVIATSTTSAISYVRDEISNMRLGMTLETATTIGGVLGGITATFLSREILSAIFGIALVLVSGYTLVKNRTQTGTMGTSQENPGLLGGRYYDVYLKQHITYPVHRLPLGLLASFVAGNISGLLGIGGGPIKVPAMTLGMGIPMKAAAATSNFMIGVTACASAYIYYTQGSINPMVAVPIAIGTTVGSYLGSRLVPSVNGTVLTKVLAIILLLLAVQMGLAALGIRVR